MEILFNTVLQRRKSAERRERLLLPRSTESGGHISHIWAISALPVFREILTRSQHVAAPILIRTVTAIKAENETIAEVK
jgi:hypothetical protein